MSDTARPTGDSMPEEPVSEGSATDDSTDSVPVASVLPWRSSDNEADLTITVYIVTGKHGKLRIPENFCRECNLFVRAAGLAAKQVDSDVNVRVVSWWTHILSALGDDVDFAVLFFQRDHYCTNCRKQVQQLADHVEEFRERNADIVSIVPEPIERVESWQDSYDLPYPLLADADAEVGEAYDQPVRFGLLGRFSDFFGRMPEVVIVDRRGPTPEIAYVHQGRSTFDRPDIDDLIAELDSLGET